MDFPNWVPNAVRNYIVHILSVEADYEEAAKTWPAAFGGVPSHWQGAAIKDLKALADVDHGAMKDAYDILGEKGLTDEQWEKFIRAAWDASKDYGKIRTLKKEGVELNREIAEAAKKLISLLGYATKLKWPLGMPIEFGSIVALLEATHPDDPRWAAALDRMMPANDIDRMLWWQWSPSLANCLESLAKVADAYKPEGDDAIAAAISSRKNNAEVSYIRAFAVNLRDAGFDTTSSTMTKVIAITASVMSSAIDSAVTDEAVNKTLSRTIRDQKTV